LPQLSSIAAAAARGAVAVTGSGFILQLDVAGATTSTDMFDSTIHNPKTGLTDLGTGVRKRACSWGLSGTKMTGDGVTPASATFDGSMGAATTLGIGNYDSGSNPWNGFIK